MEKLSPTDLAMLSTLVTEKVAHLESLPYSSSVRDNADLNNLRDYWRAVGNKVNQLRVKGN